MHRLQQTLAHIVPQQTNTTQSLQWHIDTTKHKLKPLHSRYIIRSLELKDYNKQLFQLMSQLTKAPQVTQQQFTHTFNIRQQCTASTYNTVVIEDTEKQIIVACATLVIEYKFIRDCGIVGHIEDVCVDKRYRGNDFGLYITHALIQRAMDLKCYKVILDCEPHNIPFYERCGFKENAKHMALYL